MSNSGVIPIYVNVDDSELENALAMLNDAVGMTNEVNMEANNVQKQAEELLANTGTQIKGVEAAGHRIIRMIPGLREADRLQKSIGQLSTGNIMGALTITLLAYNIIMQVKRLYDEQKRQQEQYTREVMQSRGYTTQQEYQQWEKQQNAGAAASRTRNTPR
ncbi:MAG: hypothetical protein FWG55_05825 [Candidatus Bathyarchaeota archaeon]|nr:hypothetical protein [Candidatus Termiticorpusculum sp.]